MSLSRARSAGQTGARGLINITLSNGATWNDSFRIDVDGAEIADADTSAWRLMFRDENGSIVLTAQTGGALTVTQHTTYTLFEINVPVSSLQGLCGDYTVDLVEKTSGGDIVHWLHGTATVRDEPLWAD